MKGVGDQVGGRWRLDALIGGGAAGTVFRGRGPDDAPVAIKLLDRRAAASLAGELSALAAVRHPAVVTLLDHGVDDGLPYLVLEWIAGETLAAQVTRRPLAIADVLALGAGLAGGIAAAHRAGIVHRDLKPSNVVLTGGDPRRPRLIDFGIARAGPDAGAPAGTPGYMAPEQIRGDAVDGRADVFALGCLLWEALAGRPAFRGPHPIAVLTRTLFDDPPPIDELRADVPPALAELLAAMLDRDPARRPDAAAVQARLDAIDATAVTTATHPIGGDEQRTVAVVLARFDSPDEAARAATTVRALSAALGVEVVPGAGLAITIATGAATDRAVTGARAALAIRDAAAVAIATGTSRRAAVVGDAIDRAADLLATVAQGAIIVDDVTAGLLDARFAMTSAFGRWRLVGELRGEPGVRRLLGRPSAIVGRDRELAVIDAAILACVEDSAAHVVLITAPAGVGKSRLRQEVVARIERRDAAPRSAWIARGDPMRAGSPFGVLGQLVRAAVGRGDGEPFAAAVRARIAEMVADRPRVTTFLCELLGLPADDSPQLRAARSDPLLMHDQMRRAFIDWLSAEAGAAPVVIALEDLHWADAPSLRFLDEALRALRDRPLLVLGFGRPELLTAAPELFRRHHPTELRLAPLAPRACEALVRGALGDVDASTIARLVERSAGNAFYLEELIRAVAAGQGGELPPTVMAMVHARLDAVPPAQRRLLRAGSVLGRAFARGSVAALVGEPAADLVAPLGELVARELLGQRVAAASPDDDVFTFRHELVREAAYAMLTADDRRAGHHAAAAWLEARGAGDAVVLAQHWELGGEPARAASWYRRAAEAALAANDFAGVLAAVARATAGSEADRGALALLAAEAHGWRGELAAGARCAEEAADHLDPGTPRWLRAIAFAATMRGRFGDYGGIDALTARAMAAPALSGSRTERLTCLCALTRQQFHAGRYAQAARTMETVDALAAEDGLEPHAAAQVHGLRAAAARHAGDLAGDLAGYRRVQAAFEAAGDARSACNAQVSVGFAHMELGAWTTAEALLRAALADAERMGLATVATRARQNLALTLARTGALEDATRLVDQTIAESRAHGNARFEGWTQIYQAEIALAAGDAAAAEAAARAAAAQLVVSPPARAGALAIHARALLAAGRADDAEPPAREAMAILTPLVSIEEFEAVVRLTWAQVADARGDHAERDRAIGAARDRLQVRAAAIADPQWRASFLAEVPENRDTLALAARWLDH